MDIEHFVGRKGAYHYYLNGKFSGVTEHWSVRYKSNAIEVQSLRTAKNFGTSMMVKSLHTDGDIKSTDIFWQQENKHLPFEVKAHYQFFDDRFSLDRSFLQGDHLEQDKDQEFLLEKFSEKGSPTFSPLMRFYTGEVIQKLMDKGGKDCVIVPCIQPQSSQEQLLTPLASSRKAEHRGAENITLLDRRFATDCYEYQGGEYQPGTLFWLAEDGLLLKYQWQQDSSNKWEVELVDHR